MESISGASILMKSGASSWWESDLDFKETNSRNQCQKFGLVSCYLFPPILPSFLGEAMGRRALLGNGVGVGFISWNRWHFPEKVDIATENHHHQIRVGLRHCPDLGHPWIRGNETRLPWGKQKTAPWIRVSFPEILDTAYWKGGFNKMCYFMILRIKLKVKALVVCTTYRIIL